MSVPWTFRPGFTTGMSFSKCLHEPGTKFIQMKRSSSNSINTTSWGSITDKDSSLKWSVFAKFSGVSQLVEACTHNSWRIREWLFQPSIFMTAVSGFVPLDSLLRHNVVGSVTWPTYVQTDVVSQGKVRKPQTVWISLKVNIGHSVHDIRDNLIYSRDMS